MSNIPHHVAFIMDGNRRWASINKLPVFKGHKKGEEKIEPLVDTAMEMGIKYLTFWAFSTENWKREKDEVEFLLRLYRQNLHKKIDNFHKKNVKVNVIGNLEMFPRSLREKTQSWVEKTKNNNRITVNIALSYGGRDEIVRAINKWRAIGSNNRQSLSKEDFSQYLDTAGEPDPDLLIRTGGEQRLSGFMLWQLEYSELVFTPTLWPDFTPEKFRQVISEFNLRKRRYGK